MSAALPVKVTEVVDLYSTADLKGQNILVLGCCHVGKALGGKTLGTHLVRGDGGGGGI